MRWFKADLHIHSVLSPCADLEMSPSAIVERAVQRKLDIIAITDHNSLANTAVCRRAAEKAGIVCIPGVEVQTAEEIHVVCLFPSDDSADKFNTILYEALPNMQNNPDFFGDQPVVDDDNNIVRFEEKALINSVLWDLAQTVRQAQACGGWCFPAHVDHYANSVLGQLGFVPDDPPLDTLGLTAGCNLTQFRAEHPELDRYTLLRNSDAHYLIDVGRGFSRLFLAEPTLAEIVKACRCEDGRQLRLDSL